MSAGDERATTIALDLLRSSGWTSTRRVEIADAVDALRCAGYDIGPALEALLSNIAGLVLRFTRGARPDSIVVDPQLAVRRSFPAWVADYSRRAGSPLVPVGFSNHEHLLLLVTPRGHWYGGFDDEFGALGASVVEMVDRVANGRGFEEDSARD